MSRKILAYDLGTSGNKASLYDPDGNCLCSAFIGYPTSYPEPGLHEQKPEDWWNAVIDSTCKLLSIAGGGDEIECLSISGHSLGAVPIDKQGNLLRAYTPIWSDVRAKKERDDFFSRIDQEKWYMKTGNGFPAECYTIFKVMWYQNNEPELFREIFKILGTKDFINFRLTGKIMTDHSYASGSGIYSLLDRRYDPDFVNASGIPQDLFPDIVPSTHIVGELRDDMAELLHLNKRCKVVCGGVDNSCMALGAGNIESGRVYTSLGSSAWIAVSSEKPILDAVKKPYVFAHVIPDLFTSAVSIFSAGTSLNWVKDHLCQNLTGQATEGKNPYALMDEIAEKAPIGSNNLLFNPSLAGGNSQDVNTHIRGAYLGLDLKHGQAELIRSCMEGIALNLRMRLDLLRKYCEIQDTMFLIGGGSKSALYRRIFADVYHMDIVCSSLGQETGSLGAAAVAAVGCGLWKSFRRIDEKETSVTSPIEENNVKYEKILPVFEFACECQAKISEMLSKINI